MYFVILDSTGNLIASYRDEDDARAALDRLVQDDPDAADEVALLAYDDEGAVAADPVFSAATTAVTIHADSHEWYGTPSQGDWQRGDSTGQIAEPVGS